MVSSIPLLLLLFLFTLPTHNSSLEDVLSNDQPNGFFLPFESNLYVEITIGTPTRTFNLKLDSSTHLTFLECNPCDDDHQCSLSDTTRRYDGKSSTTFSPISCDNSSLCPHLSPNATNNHYNATKTAASLSLLCTPSNSCRYDVASFSAGNLVSDTLQLTSSITDQENSLSIVHGFVFGCGTSNRVTPEDDGGGVDGRVSLTTHHFSLLSQLRITRYSHCLWPSSAGSRNYIRLGSAAEYGGDMMLVPMLNTTEKNSYSYHIALDGISLEEHRMRSNESSTIAIDIGTYYTRLEIPLYEEVKEEIMTQIGPTVAYEVNELMCFTTEVGVEIESLPKLTLHFQGFNYTISNKGFYLRDSPSSFCTALVRSTMEDEEKNVLGASGLFDYAVGYDTSETMLAFQQRDCLADFVDGNTTEPANPEGLVQSQTDYIRIEKKTKNEGTVNNRGSWTNPNAAGSSLGKPLRREGANTASGSATTTAITRRKDRRLFSTDQKTSAKKATTRKSDSDDTGPSPKKRQAKRH